VIATIKGVDLGDLASAHPLFPSAAFFSRVTEVIGAQLDPSGCSAVRTPGPQFPSSHFPRLPFPPHFQLPSVLLTL